MCSWSPLQTELDCFLLFKTQATHYLESLALIWWNSPTGRDHVLFFSPYFWRQTCTDLFWFTNRIMFLPQTQASFMSFQSVVYSWGQSFPKEDWSPSVGGCVQSHGCVPRPEFIRFGRREVLLHRQDISRMPTAKLKPRGQVTFFKDIQ